MQTSNNNCFHYLNRLPRELITFILVFSTCPSARLQARATCKKFKELIDEAAKNELYSRRIECQIQSSIAKNQLVEALYAYTTLLINDVPLFLWKTVTAFGSVSLNTDLKQRLSLNALALLNCSHLVLNTFQSTTSNSAYFRNSISSNKQFQNLPNVAPLNNLKTLFFLALLDRPQAKENEFLQLRNEAYSYIFAHSKFIENERLRAILSERKKTPDLKRYISEELNTLALGDKRFVLDIEAILTEIAIETQDQTVRSYAIKALIKPIYQYNAIISNEALQKIVKTFLIQLTQKNGEHLFNFLNKNSKRSYIHELINNLATMAVNCETFKESVIVFFEKIFEWGLCQPMSIYGAKNSVLFSLRKIAMEEKSFRHPIYTLIRNRISKISPYDLKIVLVDCIKIATMDANLKREIIAHLQSIIESTTENSTPIEIEKALTICESLITYSNIFKKNPPLKYKVTEYLIMVIEETTLLHCHNSALHTLQKISLLEENESIVKYLQSILTSQNNPIKDRLKHEALSCLKCLAIEHENLQQKIIRIIKENIENKLDKFEHNKRILETLQQIYRANKN